MLPWFQIVSGALKLVNFVAGYMHRMQLINEGEKNVIQESTTKTIDVLLRAKKRHKRVANMSDADLDNEL